MLQTRSIGFERGYWMSILPDEILLGIAEQLSAEALTPPKHFEEWQLATRTLANLCLVSRTMCSFAQPVLYRSFVNDYDVFEQYADEDDSDLRSPTSLEYFLRTLLDRPDLAGQVRSLRLQNLQVEDEELEVRDELSSPNEELLDSFIAATSESVVSDHQPENHEWQERWRNNLATGLVNAEATLLLTVVHDLKLLDVETCTADVGGDIHSLFQQIFGNVAFEEDKQLASDAMTSYVLRNQKLLAGSSPILPRLETLIMRQAEFSDSLDLSHCLNMITIPTLKSLFVHGCDICFDQDPARYHFPFQNLRNLHLENMNIGPSALSSLVEDCSHLRSLALLFPEMADNVDIRQDFLDKLAQRSETLESLQLVIPDKYYGSFPDNLFDVRRLIKLKLLEISQRALLPKSGTHTPEPKFHDLIPSSVEQLILRWVEDDMTPYLTRFVDMQSYNEFPNLKYIELVKTRRLNISMLERAKSARSTWIAIRDRFEKMCNQAGIGFKVWSEEEKYDFENPIDGEVLDRINAEYPAPGA
ncbi:hypothetical protein E4T38_04828 [Aureobasidium subglaciale]|nr:hypothetical protein E4T38_04828 [Aureobasidium subglaciale]KAI5222819.1 hypothetical protein E4T40_04742 [Aureobasidium subglaciale]KAI5226672.1 hypothetical protein E4T41_04685 [Aureobasidium subglaciale]KAI5263136.1 hypothetical protein E4T46_03930 [Aureobasidium subglaciale]